MAKYMQRSIDGFLYDAKRKEKSMIRLIIVSSNKGYFSEFAAAFTEDGDVQLSWAESGAEALELAAASSIDLVVTDELLDDMTALELAGKLVKRNPMTNCACVSSLSLEKFQEVSEGLGLMPPLPFKPGAKEGETLLSTLRQLKKEMGAANG